MDFNYLGYTETREIVKGTISAPSEETAAQRLIENGYRVISLKPVAYFMPNWRETFPALFRVKPEAIIMFFRQLALLLESGTNIVTSIDMLRAQTSDRNLKRVLGEAVSDLRIGNPLSAALAKHPESFPPICCRSLGVGEQTGSLETVLRQMADYMEKEITATKEIKNALKYPVIVAIVAIVVIGVIVTFVLPAFTGLYSLLEIELPFMTRLLLSVVGWFTSYGLYLFAAVAIIALSIFLYVKTPQGRLRWDRLFLKLPLMGRVSQLDELAHCCRSMSLLFKAGLPLPEIMSLVIDGSDNRVVRGVLADVRQDMLEGEGLSRPMAKNELFLPLMVQMVGVGEETGNLDVTLTAVAEHFETEAKEKMRSFIGLIQPAITLVIGAVVAFIALSLISAMYSVYGQVL